MSLCLEEPMESLFVLIWERIRLMWNSDRLPYVSKISIQDAKPLDLVVVELSLSSVLLGFNRHSCLSRSPLSV